MQETVEPPPARTVFGSVAGKLDVDEGVVLSQPHDMRRRRHRADCVADTHVVEDVETWRMDSVSRQDLVARKSVLVQEQDGSAGSGEERRERSTGASRADDNDVITGLCSHGHTPPLVLIVPSPLGSRTDVPLARNASSCALWRQAGCPKVLGRVGAPRSPALGPREQVAGRRPLSFRIGQGAQQADVARWKRIRLAQFTHRDVLCGPLANARQGTKLRHTFIEASSGAKDVWIRNDGRRQRRERRRAHPRHPERRQVRRRHLFRTREDMSEPVCLQAGAASGRP